MAPSRIGVSRASELTLRATRKNLILKPGLRRVENDVGIETSYEGNEIRLRRASGANVMVETIISEPNMSKLTQFR